MQHFTDQPFKSKTIVFTGELESMTRIEAEETIEAMGGHVTTKVDRHIDYLVKGNYPGSRYNMAKAIGIPVLNETQFLQIVYQALH